MSIPTKIKNHLYHIFSGFRNEKGRERWQNLNSNTYRLLFLVMLLLLLILLPLMSLQTGINADERFQKPQNLYVLDFYTSLGDNTDVIEKGEGPNPGDYGKLYEFFSAAIAKTIGHHDWYDPVFHDSRHVLGALFGFLLMLFTGLLVKDLLGCRAACVALVLLFFSPSILGHSFFNVRDIPFAAGFVMGLYFIIRLGRQLPRFSWWSAAGFIIGMCIAMNTRVGGLLLIPYLFLFCIGIQVLENYHNKTLQPWLNKDLLPLSLKLILISIAGYFAGILFWPEALLDPFAHPYKTLTSLTNLDYTPRILFEGKMIKSQNVPWYYLPKFILITTPLPVISAWIALPFTIWLLRKRMHLLVPLFLLFAAVFPIAYAAYQHSTLYDGWRHMLFVYPPLLVLAALSWEALFSRIPKPALIAAAAGFLLLTLYHPILFILKNHPYEYVYFNQVIGGVKGAYSNYETDYYMLAVKDAADWMAEHVPAVKEDEKKIVAGNAIFPLNIYLHQIDTSLIGKYSNFHYRGNVMWDYGIFSYRFVSKNYLLKHWPPQHTLHSIKVDEVPLAVVMDRTDYRDYQGYEFLKNRQFDSAASLLTAHLEDQPEDALAWYGVGRSHYHLGWKEAANEEFDKSLMLVPDILGSLYYQGLYFQEKNNYARAIKNFDIILDLNPNSAETYMSLGLTYHSMKKWPETIFNLRRFVMMDTTRLAIALPPLYEAYVKNGETAKAQQLARRYPNYINDSTQSQPRMGGTQAGIYGERIGQAYDLLMAGHEDSALVILKEIYNVDPNFPQVKDYMIAAYVNQGVEANKRQENREAIQFFEEALAVDSANKTVRSNLAFASTSLGNQLLERKAYNEAIAAYRRAVSFLPDYTEGWYNLGVAYEMSGRRDKALESVKQAYQINPKHKRTLEFLIEYSQLMGNEAEAKFYKKQLETLK